MNKIKNLGIMLDCSRQAVYTVDTVKKYIRLMQKMGYNTLQLYTEDTYTIDDPYFGYLRGRYTFDELEELDAYAKEHGIELIPCVQTLAHLSGYLRWNSEIVDCNDILLVDSEQTYAFIDKIFSACAQSFTSRRINIGMDEAHMLGLGKYLEQHGYQNRFEIINRHLLRVVEIATKYGFKPMMWSDMFFRLANNGEYDCKGGDIPQSVIDLVPQNLQLVYWDYYALDKSRYDNMIQAHKQFKNDIVFGGGAWSWSGFVPHNTFSIKANQLAIQSCMENGIEDIFITNWKDDGAECSLYSTLPSMFVAGQMAQGEFDMQVIKSRFADTFGVSFDDFIVLDELDLIEENLLHNPAKYMLYNDPFLGVFDCTVDLAKVSHFENAHKRLCAVNAGELDYVFETLRQLSAVLVDKYSLGVLTRDAYKRCDKQKLQELLPVYDRVIANLENLYHAFRNQWDVENKPFGFENHTARIGGLLLRLKECSCRINAYCNGIIGEIMELSQDILPYNKNVEKGRSLHWNNWLTTAMVKPWL